MLFKDLKGIRMKNRKYKLAAYVDNILLFLADLRTILPNLISDFDIFHFLSNL